MRKASKLAEGARGLGARMPQPTLPAQVASMVFALCILPFGPLLWWGLYVAPFAVWGLRKRYLLCAGLLLYLLWIHVLDKRVSETAARTSKHVRTWALWRWLASYFEVTVTKSAELDPEGRYLIGYHPHGIVSMGAFVAFATDGAGISRTCPGLDFHLCTLPTNFTIPFIREIVAFLGVIDSSRRAIARQLRAKGAAVVLVVGGAREALDTHGATKQKVTLYPRKGFVREALLAGAQLVPCFCFGEAEVYSTVSPDGWFGASMRFLQERGLLAYGYSVPIFWGFVPYTPIPGGFQPKRTKLSLVLGKPLRPPPLGKFEEEGRLEVVFKERLAGPRAGAAGFGFEGQAAVEGRGFVVTTFSRDPRAAWGVRSLERGMLVTTIGGRDVTALEFEAVASLLEQAQLPTLVTFTDGLVSVWHASYVRELQRVHDENQQTFGVPGEELVIS